MYNSRTSPIVAARLTLLFLVAGLSVRAAWATDAAASARPPNLVVIFCDNLGYGDVEPFGSTVHRTPHLNRMAREGMKFTHFCVTAGVCTPSRASIMTGCYAQRVGMHTNPRDGLVLRPVSPYGLNPSEVTIAEVLKPRGYATAIIGKWHLGDQPEFLPTRQGFDRFFGIPYSDDMTHEMGRRLGDRMDGSKWPPLPLMENEAVAEAPADRDLLTKRYTETALEFIEQNKDQPFFLYFPQAMPGSTPSPFASPAFKGASRNGPWGDCVEELDWSTGQVLDKLVELDIDEQTLVIWTSDNGAPMARDMSSPARGTNKPLFGRGYTTAEGAFRVPTIMWWPGKIPAGAECHELATTMDLLPTFAHLAGTLPPTDRIIDGHDIRPLLFGDPGAKSPYEVFYYYNQDQLQAIRSGQWKLFVPLATFSRHPHFQRGQKATPLLFDVVADIGSTTNVADKHPDVVRRLTALASKARADLGDSGKAGQNQRPRGRIEQPKPQVSHAADPPRMKRADAFLGIHFDFHAGDDCNQVGARTTPEMVELVIDKVQPDYIQIDCKGHRGYSSYPTKVGNPAPGFVGDPLRVWRDVTRAQGITLFMHYSGVWDDRAIKVHPEWAAVNADGKPSSRATSVFGPYVDKLMIPQLRELAGEYVVDGVWVDGDCWGTTLDYGQAAVGEFCKQTGAKSAPRKAGEPYWNQWMDFHRDSFRRYVRHYVDELKSSHPDFQVISNWAFSDHMPEPVSANVAGLSGDFSPDDSVNSARFAGRCLEDQGVPWDLMSWSFSRKTRKQKPAVQLMQEASVVLALGGGYQAYFKQDRDGAVRDPAEMDVMTEVARFCRDRQAWCHRSVAVPQIALLYSTAGHYRESPRLFHWAGSGGVAVLRRALTPILQNQYGVQILSEHHLKGKMSGWPVIIVPGWTHLEPDFRDELAAYANSGGNLLLIGPGPAKLFETEIGTEVNDSIVALENVNESFPTVLKQVFPAPIVEVRGAQRVDVSPRMLNGRLSIHLVNTSGPHANAPDGGITAIEPVGPLSVSVRLEKAPKSITVQPEGKPLDIVWRDGQATVSVPQLDLYSILTVDLDKGK